MSSVKSNPIDVLAPPVKVHGMTILDRDAFQKEIQIPTLFISVEKMKLALKVLKPYLLKMRNLQPVQEEGNQRKIFLHPGLFNEKMAHLEQTLKDLPFNVSWTSIQLGYENWTPENIFKAVLPAHTTGNVSGFSIVGHIIHLNLKPELLDYKYLIGQVFLDKFSNIKTVVNKAQVIENEFRNFHMELLAGEPNYEVTVKENGFRYTFDFSKVFWNPRLVHEHEEIVKKANSGDVVFDVFAGVGPFAIPLAKKRCLVYANDLNPDSFHWLCHNAKLNKVESSLKAYNLDGHHFIKTVIKDYLIKHWTELNSISVHIIMNLPACALEFLKTFKGLLSRHELKDIKMPIIYCYFFLKKDEKVTDVLQNYFANDFQKHLEVTPVRVVAPNKKMMRIAYAIPESVLFYSNEIDCSEPVTKKIKV
ncbi:tRNA (guanine(37)-N1)-methyltransferase-like isoform X2 [Stegodyphus dumicola]|nr:tRNA (guanine(37)-N1)-methyltransferase-like isoform X2 [Stegodyphus dumicola]